jgi:hypothetical protein
VNYQRFATHNPRSVAHIAEMVRGFSAPGAALHRNSAKQRRWNSSKTLPARTDSFSSHCDRFIES